MQHQYWLRFSKKIIIGAAYTVQEGWFSTDYPEVDITSISRCKKFWKKSSKLAFFAEHVWEHLDKDAAYRAARCCRYFLKKGGRIRVAVPDGNHPDPNYIRAVEPNGTGPGAKDHKELYTVDTLAHIFRETGFKVNPLEYWDCRGNFHKKKWKEHWGKVERSKCYDSRNTEKSPHSYTSIIIDAHKK